MHDMNDFAKLIKRAAIDAMKESKPMSIVFGTVVSIEPLKIKVEQKLTLTTAQLILTNSVRDYNLDMTVNHFTDEDLSTDPKHKHSYTGRKTFKVHNGLVAGDGVILLQMQGGQKYIVLDKAVNA